MLNVMGCLDIPTSGSYFIEDKEVSRLNSRELADIRAKKIGFIFQSFNLLHRMSAVANVELGMRFSFGIDRKVDLEALSIVGLAERANHRPTELSGGEQQRVAIARAIVKKPPFLLADEPTGNLDSKSGAEIINILKTLHDEQKMTMVMITHDRAIADNCERIIFLKDGVVIEE
jgi:putative ABC transport system ATP-binding protein